MKELLEKLEVTYAEELKTQFPLLEQKIEALRVGAVAKIPGIRLADDGKTAGTINLADMKVLYLLVRHFKPKAIFEIGTWIGTSAMVMAEAIQKNNNGGIVYTCDTADCYIAQKPYQKTIKKITAFSDIALAEIPAGTKIDFIFADGEFTFNTIKKISSILHPDAIITTHDYVLPAEKGVLNYLRLQLTSFGGYKLLSAKQIGEVIKAPTLIGIMYRDTSQNLVTSIVSRLFNLTHALLIGVRATVVRIYRKFSNYYEHQQ